MILENKNLLVDGLKYFNISNKSYKIEKLEKFYDFVCESNKKFNLTAITNEIDFINKHFIDSASVIPFFDNGCKICDIGAGAGFPSMPIAILREDVEITAFDSTAKKMVFLDDCAKKLDVINLKTVSGRIEEIKKFKNSFDFGVARAVSSLPILLELCADKLKVGGKFIAFKTDESELKNIESCLEKLNFSFFDSVCFNLPNGDNRAFLIFEKLAETPSCYPRQYGIIKKKPL